jgi:hypothetical protein
MQPQNRPPDGTPSPVGFDDLEAHAHRPLATPKGTMTPMETPTGERYGIKPSDLSEARAEGRLPRKNLIRDGGTLDLAGAPSRSRGSTPEERDAVLRELKIGPYEETEQAPELPRGSVRVFGGVRTESG